MLLVSASPVTSSPTNENGSVTELLLDTPRGQTADTCTFEDLIRNNGLFLNDGDSCYFRTHSPMDFLEDLSTHPDHVVMVLDVPDNWISMEDAELLMQMLDSDDPAAPVISPLSSFWPDNQTSTVGNEALFLLNGYRTGLYPPNICSLCDTGFNKSEMRDWWSSYGMLGLPDEHDAIRIVKNYNPELRGYPSDQFPEKTIRTEKVPGGWHVAFIQEGSGVPIISAQCYYVGDDGAVRFTGLINHPCIAQTQEFSVGMCE